jgi:two-component system chemotaxis sensor kinase CheA
LGGTLETSSALGKGTRFLLSVPVSAAIIQILLVEVDGRTLGIPITKVLRTIEVTRDEIRTMGRQLTIALEEETREGERIRIAVPLLSLRKILRLPTRSRPGTVAVVLIKARRRKVGLVVDRFVGQREVFVKSLGFPLDRLAGVSGATVLGDGRVVFIIDPQSFLEHPDGAGALPAGDPA